MFVVRSFASLFLTRSRILENEAIVAFNLKAKSCIFESKICGGPGPLLAGTCVSTGFSKTLGCPGGARARNHGEDGSSTPCSDPDHVILQEAGERRRICGTNVAQGRTGGIPVDPGVDSKDAEGGGLPERQIDCEEGEAPEFWVVLAWLCMVA